MGWVAAVCLINLEELLVGAVVIDASRPTRSSCVIVACLRVCVMHGPRSGLDAGAVSGYPSSSITDAQWAVLEPLLPARRATPEVGVDVGKSIPDGWSLDAIFYLVRGGIAWAQLPREFPPHQTVYGAFRR